MRVAHRFAITGVLLACTAHEQPTPEHVVQVEAEPEPTPPPVEVKPHVAPEPKPVPEPKPTPEPKPLPPPPDHATPIHPEPGVVEWTELPGLSDIDGFYSFVIGVLASCGPDGSQWCKLYDDGRLEVTPVELGGTIWGIWRSDAWRVEVDLREEETDDDRAQIVGVETVKVERWRGDSFQVQGRFESGVDINSYYEFGEIAEPAIVFRKGWAGGMLIYEGGQFKRLPASGPPAPTIVAPGGVLEFFEAESGAMFFVTGSRRTEQLYVHPPCSSGGCRDQVLKLPMGEYWLWDFPIDVARGGDSISVVLSGAEENPYLLHYDAPEVGQPGRWVFEALPEDEWVPDAIWPDTRGGVWMSVSKGLWYRNKDGRWFDVALPEGESYDFANRLKPREFLALVKAPDGNRVFATRGPVKPAPTVAPEP